MSVSSYKCKSGNCWRVVLSVTDPITGKRTQPKISKDPDTLGPIKTKRRAQEIEAGEITRMATGMWVPPSTLTVAGLMARWLADIKPDIAASSHRGWTSVVACRINPHLGTIPVQHLTVVQIEQWARDLRLRYKPNTIAEAKTVLGMALKAAVRWRVISRNPMHDVRRLKGAPAELPVWTADEAKRFLACVEKAGAEGHDSPGTPPTSLGLAQHHQYIALWRLLLDGGLRIGEALALAWSDLDQTTRRVRITKTLTKGDAGWVVAERTKTASGKRTVTLGEATVAAFRKHELAQKEYRLALGKLWANSGLIFTNRWGAVLSPSTASERLERDIQAAGVLRLTPHGLRRTSITLQTANGVPLSVAMERAGHSSASLTLDTYSKQDLDADRLAADALAKVLEG